MQRSLGYDLMIDISKALCSRIEGLTQASYGLWGKQQSQLLISNSSNYSINGLSASSSCSRLWRGWRSMIPGSWCLEGCRSRRWCRLCYNIFRSKVFGTSQIQIQFEDKNEASQVKSLLYRTRSIGSNSWLWPSFGIIWWTGKNTYIQVSAQQILVSFIWNRV